MLEKVTKAAGMVSTTGKQVLAAAGYFLDANDWGAQFQPHQTTLYYRRVGIDDGPLFGVVSEYSGGIGAPGCIFGKKPWMENSTTPLLPRKLCELQEVTVEHAWRAEGTGKYNVVLDCWLCRDAACHDDSIACEVMVRLYDHNMVPAGGEIAPGLWKGYGERGWPVYSFVREEQAGRVDLLTLIRSLPELSQGWYVADVELLTEIMADPTADPSRVAFIADTFNVIVRPGSA